MAEVTALEEKLGEVIGLAEAAQEAVAKVISLPESDSQSDLLDRLKEESEETEKRGRAVAERRNDGSDGILEKAEETKKEGVEMMESYLGGGDSDGLDGFGGLHCGRSGCTGVARPELEQALARTAHHH